MRIRQTEQTVSEDLKAELPDWVATMLASPVTLFQLYRLFLSILMLTIFYTHTGPSWIGSSNPQLFAISSIIYLGFVVADLLLNNSLTTRRDKQIYLMVFVDILLLSLMMNASGGVESGLGTLLAISIAAGSLMMRGRLALLFAALASLAVLSEETAILMSGVREPDFVQSSLLGIAFFAIALLAFSLSMHIKASENIAEQKQQDLANMARLNEYIIEHMQAGVIAIDFRDRLRLINHSAWKLLGRPETGDRPLLVDFCADLNQQLSQWRSESGQAEDFSPFISDSGIELKAAFTPLGSDNKAGTLIFLEDISEVTQTALQMKLASIGRLTASIAHEIRNPLGAISHAGQLLSESEALSSQDQRLTEIIRDNSSRVNEIIENILTLSRRDNSRPENIKLKPWLNDFRTKFLQAAQLQPEQIQLQIEPALAEGFFDPTQIDQVLVILANNAINHFDKDPAQLQLNINSGYTENDERVYIELRDNGPGISDEHIRQIFEPFFTTRNTGTGLGLYIARELSESNRAMIEYLKPEQNGSRFRITFHRDQRSMEQA